MHITGDELLELIPQRPPMVMIDGLRRCDTKITQTTLTVKGENIFYTKNGLNESALIENMAQTAAARAGYFAKQNKEKVRRGFIGAVKNAEINFLPKTGDILDTKMESMLDMGDISVVKCQIYCSEKLCAQAEFKIFLQD